MKTKMMCLKLDDFYANVFEKHTIGRVYLPIGYDKFGYKSLLLLYPDYSISNQDDYRHFVTNPNFSVSEVEINMGVVNVVRDNILSHWFIDWFMTERRRRHSIVRGFRNTFPAFVTILDSVALVHNDSQIRNIVSKKLDLGVLKLDNDYLFLNKDCDNSNRFFDTKVIK